MPVSSVQSLVAAFYDKLPTVMDSSVVDSFRNSQGELDPTQPVAISRFDSDAVANAKAVINVAILADQVYNNPVSANSVVATPQIIYYAQQLNTNSFSSLSNMMDDVGIDSSQITATASRAASFVEGSTGMSAGAISSIATGDFPQSTTVSDAGVPKATVAVVDAARAAYPKVFDDLQASPPKNGIYKVSSNDDNATTITKHTLNLNTHAGRLMYLKGQMSKNDKSDDSRSAKRAQRSKIQARIIAEIPGIMDSVNGLRQAEFGLNDSATQALQEMNTTLRDFAVWIDNTEIEFGFNAGILGDPYESLLDQYASMSESMGADLSIPEEPPYFESRIENIETRMDSNADQRTALQDQYARLDEMHSYFQVNPNKPLTELSDKQINYLLEHMDDLDMSEADADKFRDALENAKEAKNQPPASLFSWQTVTNAFNNAKQIFIPEQQAFLDSFLPAMERIGHKMEVIDKQQEKLEDRAKDLRSKRDAAANKKQAAAEAKAKEEKVASEEAEEVEQDNIGHEEKESANKDNEKPDWDSIYDTEANAANEAITKLATLIAVILFIYPPTSPVTTLVKTALQTFSSKLSDIFKSDKEADEKSDEDTEVEIEVDEIKAATSADSTANTTTANTTTADPSTTPPATAVPADHKIDSGQNWMAIPTGKSAEEAAKVDDEDAPAPTAPAA